MRFAPLASLVGSLALLTDCSGQYLVGNDVGRAGAGSMNLASAGAGPMISESAGTGPVIPASGGTGPTFPANAGTGSTVPANAGTASAGETSASVAGSFPMAGRGSGGNSGREEPTNAYCGTTWSPAAPVEFAAPDVVFERVSRFLLGVETPATNLPSQTSREWAGQLATSILGMLSVPAAPGMTRFVNKWWPGTPTPEIWAAYFSSKRGTLTDLFTSTSLVPEGAGVLTDPAVLSRAGFAGRGAFVLGQALCTQIPEDPTSGTTPAPLMPNQTRRAQHELTVANQPCRACHELTDPIGYALGDFATDGSYRTIDNELPIDTYATLSIAGNQLPVADAKGLGIALSGTCEVSICFTRLLFSDATLNAKVPRFATEDEIATVAGQFAATGLSLPELVRLIVESDPFLRAD